MSFAGGQAAILNAMGRYRPTPDRRQIKKMRKHLFGFVGMLLAAASVSACSFPVTSLKNQVENADDIFIAHLIEAKVVPIDEHHKWPSIEGRFQIKKILKGGKRLPSDVLSTWGI